MRLLGAVAALLALFALVDVSPGVRASRSDLDDLMSEVLQHRDENWKKLQQYVLDEREEVAFTGPGGARLWGERRDYTWYIREGFFVRSPVRANGSAVTDSERLRYEDEFLKRAKGRDAAARASDARTPDAPVSEPQSSVENLLAQTRQPQFIDSAYFLRFKFEPGRYALVGRETFENRDVLRVEYYPERLFSHEQDAESRRRAERRTDRREDMESATERSLNKVALVTLWVEPALKQIVKYTFENVDFDFLPGAWLLRVDDLKATMKMAEAFKGVWLPARVDILFGMRTAAGPFSIGYQIDYRDYREASSTGRVKAPGMVP